MRRDWGPENLVACWTLLRSSYSSHYRRMLPRLPFVREFRSNNTAHRPIIEALGLLRRYSERPGTIRFYALGDTVPLAGVVTPDWQDAVVDERGRVERIPLRRRMRSALDGLEAAVKVGDTGYLDLGLPQAVR